MDKRTRLNEIVKSCEHKFDRGTAAAWKHSDYVDLNRAIWKKTEVNISANTLKRIFGKISVDDDYLPQPATIEALIVYSDYIPLEKPAVIDEPAEQAETEQPVITEKKGRKNYKYLWLGLPVIIFLVWLLATKNSGTVLAPQGSLQQVNAEGILPTTVFFRFARSGIKDSVFLDFGDKSVWAHLQESDSMLSHNYLFPGVFAAKLRTRNTIIASTPVFVASNKWVGLAYHRQVDLPERYYLFPALKSGKDSLFHIENSQLFRLGLDTSRSVFTRLCNFSSTAYKKDDFIFEASFKNKLIEKGIYCNSVQFHIAGLNKSIRFKFVNAGCSYRVINLLSEKVFEGNKVDLSAFVIDLQNWNQVKLVNKNKSVQLLVNNQLLFQDNYTQPLGEIKGVFVEFEGNGFIQYCRLTSDDGKPLFSF